VVLRPTRHRIGHFGDAFLSQSLGLVWKKTKPNTTKACIQQGGDGRRRRLGILNSYTMEV